MIYEPYPHWWYLGFCCRRGPRCSWARMVLRLAPAHARPRHRRVIVVVAGGLGVATAQRAACSRSGHRTAVRDDRAYCRRHHGAIGRHPDVAHSGTVRYYAGRVTLRFDLLDPAWLDRAIAWLEARGHHPYILLEDWERRSSRRSSRREPARGSRLPADRRVGVVTDPRRGVSVRPAKVRRDHRGLAAGFRPVAAPRRARV